MAGLKDNNGFSWDDIFMWPTDILWGGKKNAPFFGQLYDDDQQQAVVDAMKNVQQMYADHRPQSANARQTGLNNTLSLFNGANSQLGEMYGKSLNFDMRNPLQDMFDAMAAKEAADKEAKYREQYNMWRADAGRVASEQKTMPFGELEAPVNPLLQSTEGQEYLRKWANEGSITDKDPFSNEDSQRRWGTPGTQGVSSPRSERKRR